MELLLLVPKNPARAWPGQSEFYVLLAGETLPSITVGRTRRIPHRALEDSLVARETTSGQPSWRLMRHREGKVAP